MNPDNSAFQVALNSEIYVDKTGLLEYTNKVLDTKQGYICNSRPRRFGKSITADMLSAYYSKGCDSKKMFADLKIGSSEDFQKHLNKYDVIHLDIQWFLSNVGNGDKLVAYLTDSILNELRESYPESLASDTKMLPEALSRIKEKTGKKFIIIIDEWDVLIREEAANQQVQDEYINFLKGMFKGSEPTKYIQFAFLTGILPIKKLKTQSALNNFMQYSMLNAGPLANYIGFTEEEVMELCTKYHRDFAEVKRWYDGYYLGQYHVYNPNAVVNLMLEGDFQSYWSETGTYESIVPFIGMDFDGLRTSIIEMLSGSSVNVKVTSFKNDMVSFVNQDDVLTLLIHLGYLAYNQKRQTVSIPNEEIRQEFLTAVTANRWNEKVETAMQQMKEKQYPASLENYTGEMLLVGISYDKKNKKHQCLIEQYNKEKA